MGDDLHSQAELANADLKAAKARAKALRPWYKKKRYWALGILAFAFISSAVSGGNTPAPTFVQNATVADSSQNNDAVNSQETLGQSNARKSATEYLNVMSFSRQGLIDQMVSGSKFTDADATYGVDASNADWNAQAAKSAKEYLKVMSFSHDGLVEQLVSGSKFTQAQAQYGVGTTGL
jgi:hypothetical protein